MKTIRTGVYALLKYQDKIIVIKKGRGPFTGLYDLPGGKIEHGEGNIESLKRELQEEVGLHEDDYSIEKLLSVEEDFIYYISDNNNEKDEHIIAIIYLVNVTNNNIDLEYIEQGGDANGLLLISRDNTTVGKTNILQKALDKRTK